MTAYKRGDIILVPQPSVCLVDQNLTKSGTGRLSEVQRAEIGLED